MTNREFLDALSVTNSLDCKWLMGLLEKSGCNVKNDYCKIMKITGERDASRILKLVAFKLFQDEHLVENLAILAEIKRRNYTGIGKIDCVINSYIERVDVCQPDISWIALKLCNTHIKLMEGQFTLGKYKFKFAGNEWYVSTPGGRRAVKLWNGHLCISNGVLAFYVKNDITHMMEVVQLKMDSLGHFITEETPGVYDQYGSFNIILHFA